MRFLFALLLLAASYARADHVSTNQAVVEVSSLYPGAVLSAELLPNHEDVFVRLLSPAGLVHKLVVCKQNSVIKIKEILGENTGSRRSGCDTVTVKD